MLIGFLKVFPIIFLVLLGVFFKRTNYMKKNSIEDIKKLVLNVSLPCLLYTAFYRLEFSNKYLLIMLTIFITCGFMLFMGTSIKKLFKIKSTYFSTLFVGFETGMFGYSLFAVAYGVSNIDKLAIIDLAQVIFVFFVIMPMYKNDSTEKSSILNTLKNFIQSPVIIAISLGILTSIFGKRLVDSSKIYSSIFEIITFLSVLTVPLICIVIGYEMKLDMTKIKLPLITVSLRLLILIPLALIINRFIIGGLLDLPNIYKQALFTMFILPPPFVLPIFIKEDGDDMQYVLNTISLSMIFTIIIFWILLVFM
ncbi:MAG: AEC family transporter [Clostridiaceae bacterium]